MTPEDLAQIAFEAYYSARFVNGHILTWAGTSAVDRAAWVAAASAVKGAVLGPMTRVNET